jgi:hypothetical protein
MHLWHKSEEWRRSSLLVELCNYKKYPPIYLTQDWGYYLVHPHPFRPFRAMHAASLILTQLKKESAYVNMAVLTCADIDECKISEFNNCSLKAESECWNTNGSYTCQCPDNYVQFSDRNCGSKYSASIHITSTPNNAHLALFCMTYIQRFQLHRNYRCSTGFS